MRYLYLLLILLVVGTHARCQQLPFYTQYILNPFVTNPALAGIEDYWDVKLSYRSQWQGMEGAPKTVYATCQGPIRHIQYSKPTTATIYRDEAQRRHDEQKRWMQHRSIINHAGVGLTALSDKAGPVTRYAVHASYAYHIGLSSSTSISAGLSGGVQGVRVDMSALDFGTNNPADPSIGTADRVSEVRPDISLGFYLYSRSYFIGLSAQNVVPSTINYSGNGQGTLVPHYLASAGYKVAFNEDVTFLPSFMLRLVQHTPLGFDINTKLQYRDIAWVGASYRRHSGFAGMLGFNISSSLNVGYSYDLSRMGSLPYGGAPTHEVIIGLLFRNANRVRCPSDFW